MAKFTVIKEAPFIKELTGIVL